MTQSCLARKQNDEKDFTPIHKPIQRGAGHSYLIDAPLTCPHNPKDWTDSRLFVFEDGKPLGPTHTPLPLVQRDGAGRFTYYKNQIHFSTSDNSDPNTNGRTYSFAPSDELYFADRYAYCNVQVKWFLRKLEIAPHNLNGKRILEIGPGRDIGMALIMSGLGAHTVGIEKYRAGWLDHWHEPFIQAICKRTPTDYPTFNTAPLQACLKTHDFSTAHIDFIPLAMEDFDPLAQPPFDFTYSMAVMEHVSDPALVVQKMYQATKSGGKGLHAVDFRDHRNFARPLEHYLLDDDTFHQLSQQCETYNFGNRTLPSHLTAMWEDAGFSKVTCAHNGEAIKEDYIQEFLPRLRASSTRFKDVSEADLRMISAYYVVEKA